MSAYASLSCLMRRNACPERWASGGGGRGWAWGARRAERMASGWELVRGVRGGELTGAGAEGVRAVMRVDGCVGGAGGNDALRQARSRCYSHLSCCSAPVDVSLACLQGLARRTVGETSHRLHCQSSCDRPRSSFSAPALPFLPSPVLSFPHPSLEAPALPFPPFPFPFCPCLAFKPPPFPPNPN